MATTKLWTVEEDERLPDDNFRYALIKGALYRMPPPMGRHGLVANTIGRVIDNVVADPSGMSSTARMCFPASDFRWPSSSLDQEP